MPNAQIENLLSSLKSESISLKSEIEKLQCNLRSLHLSNNNLREDNQILIAKENSLQNRIIVLEDALQAAFEENNKLKEDEQWQQVQNMCYTNANSQAKNPPTQVFFECQNSYEILKLHLHIAIYRLRFYSNLLIHILSLSNLHNNVASIQRNRGDKSHRVIVA